MTDRRSGWPWEIQGTNDPRVSGAAAPIGETYRNVSTSDLFQKFGPGNFDWRLITGTVTAQQTAIVDPARGNDATGKFGDLALSFKTIQAAINAVPTPVDAPTARTIWTILVSPGTYDEDLAVDLTHGKKIILASWGPWNLGLFNSPNWQPSNTRNITITTSDNVAFDFINPSFSIEPMLPVGTGDETEIAQHSVPRISGKIDLTGVAAGTLSVQLLIEAQIYGVAGAAIVAGTTDVTLFVRRSRMRGTVTGSVLVLEDATESRFDQLLDIEGYGRIEECFLGNGMTVVATAPTNPNLPGFYDCQLNGTFTGPSGIDAFWFDLVTSYWFGANGCLFAGGVTRRLVELTPTSQQTAIVDPVFGNDATGTFGILAFPFKTIQAAISAVPTPVDAATARTIWTILVSPGTYDEDLAVDLTHGKKIILASWGPWNLGLFNSPNWQPSNTRNITITTSDNVAFDFINPSFSIEPMLPVGTGDETEIAQHSVPRISGKIDLTGVAAGTLSVQLLVEAQIYGVAGAAIVAGTTDVTLFVRRSRMRGTVTGSVLVLEDATESRFDQLLDIEAYGRIEECFLGNGMTVVATAPTNPNLPGIYDTQLNGTFTGPAGIDAFWFDLVTNYWFTTNGCTFAGGATKRIVETANFSGGWLGDGSDGAVTISVNTTLTRNMFYSSLTIDPGIILNPGGYAIFCTGTITINGSIEHNGNNGTPGAAGIPGSGVGAPALASGFLFGSYAGGTGGFGGGVAAIAGGSTLNSPRGYAGTGGAGGFAGFSAAGPGGTVTNELPQGGDVRTIREMVKLRDAFGAYIDCGAGGGGGGGAAGGGAGGGGGSGGGVIMIAARAFAGAGPVRSRGGAGAASSIGPAAGGGGGGMGGFIGLVIAEGAAPTTDISGGAGGAPAAVPGAPGSAGLVIVLTIQP